MLHFLCHWFLQLKRCYIFCDVEKNNCEKKIEWHLQLHADMVGTQILILNKLRVRFYKMSEETVNLLELTKRINFEVKDKIFFKALHSYILCNDTNKK